MVPVFLNDRGPYPMVVDTAAQSSLVTAQLATETGLEDLRSGVRVSGIAGGSNATVYGVKHLSSRLFDIHDTGLPALPNSAVTDAYGILGMDLFAERKLVFDNQAQTLRVEPSGPPAPGFVAIKGWIDDDGSLVIPLTVNGQAVDAVVDSGAEGTIADSSLIDLLGWSSDDPRIRDAGTMRGAGAGSTRVRSMAIDALQIGPVRFRNLSLVIAPGGVIGSDGRSRILLGSNVLSLLLAYAVDIPRGELQVRVPAGAAG